MKKMMTTMMIATISTLCACAIDASSDEEELTSEETSELTGTVTCTGFGAGSCTASSMPTGWTIQQGPGTAQITGSGLTANWFCFGSNQTRLVTAVGVGTTTVQCSRR